MYKDVCSLRVYLDFLGLSAIEMIGGGGGFVGVWGLYHKEDGQ